MIYFKLGEHYLLADERRLTAKRVFDVLRDSGCSGQDGHKAERISPEEAFSNAAILHFLFEADIDCAKCTFVVTDERFLDNPSEGVWQLRSAARGASDSDGRLLRFLQEGRIKAVNLAYPRFYLCFGGSSGDIAKGACGGGASRGDIGNGNAKKSVNILALGDVGGTLLLGLKLMGGDVISTVGIYDISNDMACRMEMEMNQISDPCDAGAMPVVRVIDEDQLFDADMFVFCASKGVPSVGQEAEDVRMIQYEENRRIVAYYAKLAAMRGFQGIFAVVSDPVDLLCLSALEAGRQASTAGVGANFSLRPEQIKGYGLGVMNSRGIYYARMYERFSSYIERGRCFGPHGRGLYLVNDINAYDPAISEELTDLALTANLKVRQTGYKPYIAPAISSGSIAIIRTLSGKWHYSSNYLQGVYMGARNRMGPCGLELESIPMSDILYARICEIHEALRIKT